MIVAADLAGQLAEKFGVQLATLATLKCAPVLCCCFCCGSVAGAAPVQSVTAAAAAAAAAAVPSTAPALSRFLGVHKIKMTLKSNRQ